MKKNKINVLDKEINSFNTSVKGSLINKDNELYYKIENYDKMDPFLISIVSASDHWLYISSKGGLTAGRRNSDNALFAYSNDDVLHDINEITGNKTIFKLKSRGKLFLWEPFSDYYDGIYSVKRNLYKNISSTEIIFEEINYDLNLKYRYSWTCSEKFGFIKSSQIFNLSKKKIEVEILDGIQNILPSGVSEQLQREYSTLVNGYKKNELLKQYGLGIYSLSSIPSDRAQPAESLLATTVWSKGIKVKKYLLSVNQLKRFRNNLPIYQEENVFGIRGAYFINSQIKINSSENIKWFIASDLNQNIGSMTDLFNVIKRKNCYELVQNDIQESKRKLIKIVGESDGLQLTGNLLNSSRHFSNVLFNVMRGGIFDNSYNIEKTDFISFVKKANPFVYDVHKDFLNNLNDSLSVFDLKTKVNETNDTHFIKLAYEYMPLTFSRRHGDPSRPWNKFSIEIKNNAGKKVLNYQGNWRDIFQNWEALALSFPGFLDSMIAKFLNTSTADGYNPYRIGRDGFDWEVQEPHNPWANIGYWGDHQVIYLLKLLELLKEFNPSTLNELLYKEIFSFANVPYRIKDYQEILKDPRNTIEFDYRLDEELKRNEMLFGSDSKHLKKKDNTLVFANLIEKILIMLLVKISNFVPGGGIWMNTQRPEWNDAKNALVGQGVSMVTLYYLRRFIIFFINVLNESSKQNFNVSKEVFDYFTNINFIFSNIKDYEEVTLNSKKRKNIVDLLGTAGSDYRKNIYQKGFLGEKQNLTSDEIINLCKSILSAIDLTIKQNKREDGLYHSYNILHFQNDEIKITHLYEMLEGQVAILSSGFLSTFEAIELLSSLRKSKLYRKDQHSYLLYPNRNLPKFIEKNIIPSDLINKSKLLLKLLSDGNSEIIYTSQNGNYHFQNDIINSDELKKKISLLAPDKYEDLVKEELSYLLELYEIIFKHNEFTGRATTFYKYEGLGSIYWHMVSKLLLAVQEVFFNSVHNSAPKKQIKKLREYYYDIKKGIGVSKSPSQFGAFPIDPYSHTPSFSGVQQPGMTGQVKEDIITRFRELGIHIKDSKIFINPTLLNNDEFLKKKEVFTFYNLNSEEETLSCQNNSFAITYCQIPFRFSISDKDKIIVYKKDGEKLAFDDLFIDEEISREIFFRKNYIDLVEVMIKSDRIL